MTSRTNGPRGARCLTLGLVLFVVSTAACALPLSEPAWNVAELPTATEDGFAVRSCADLQTESAGLFRDHCDGDGDGAPDAPEAIVVSDPGTDGIPASDDDRVIVAIVPDESGAPRFEFAAEGGYGDVENSPFSGLEHPNPGCELMVVFEAIFDLPPSPHLLGCEALPAPSPASSCRECLAAQTTRLVSGGGVIGECSLARAALVAAQNRLDLFAGEPLELQQLANEALDHLSGEGRGGPWVACPPTVAGLQLIEARPQWDDLLYAGSCAEVCMGASATPLGCFERTQADPRNPCADVFYARDPVSGTYSLSVADPATEPTDGLVDTHCMEAPIADTHSLSLCCPNPEHPEAGFVLGGVECGELGALSAPPPI